jgi:hypothetical protein
MKESAKDKPNKSRLRSLGEALIITAKALRDAAPAVLSIAEKVVVLVAKIHDLG